LKRLSTAAKIKRTKQRFWNIFVIFTDIMEAKNIIEIRNKRAEYEYFLMDTYTAGIVLTGTEIKSIRDGKVNLSDAFCMFRGTELYVT
jgi:SsrA-binding protein